MSFVDFLRNEWLTQQGRLTAKLGLFGVKERSLHAPVPADPDRHGIALVAIVKDESAYIAEWIAFHAILGVRSMYIYDNGSTDETVALVKGLGALVNVRVVPWINFGRHIRVQTAAYNHALANFGRRYRWMMFLDIDEFVFPKTGGSLNETMAAYDALPAISLPWHMFGPSGHVKRPNGLVIEAYQERAPFPPDAQSGGGVNYKTIADPSAVKWAHTHYCEFWNDDGAMFNDAGRRFWRTARTHAEHATAERIQLNHYATRSVEEFEQRIGKGRVSKEGQVEKRDQLRRRLERLNRPGVRDDGAARFAADVRSALSASDHGACGHKVRDGRRG